MKKAPFFSLLIVHCSLLIAPAGAAPPSISTGGGGGSAPLTIKKASAVEEQKQEKMDAFTGTNLIGTAIGIFSGIQALKKEEQALAAGCAPSTQDVAFVNKMVKEYAKTGQQTAESMLSNLGAESSNGYCTYLGYVTGGKGTAKCYDIFDSDTADKGRIWHGYPEAKSLNECPPEKPNCKDGKKYYSNVYEIYAQMGWDEADLLQDEISAHSKLMARAEECSPDVLKRKQKEMAGSLITGTIGGLGKKQNTAGTMQAVGGLMQNMNSGNSALQGIGTMGVGMIPELLGGR